MLLRKDMDVHFRIQYITNDCNNYTHEMRMSIYLYKYLTSLLFFAKCNCALVCVAEVLYGDISILLLRVAITKLGRVPNGKKALEDAFEVGVGEEGK